MQLGNGYVHLFYDPSCPLCVRFKDSLIRFYPADKIRFFALNDLGSDFIDYQEQFKKEIHLLSEEGVWFKGPQAIQYLISECPSVKKFSWLIESQAGKKASELFYKRAQRFREQFQRCSSCDKH